MSITRIISTGFLVALGLLLSTLVSGVGFRRNIQHERGCTCDELKQVYAELENLSKNEVLKNIIKKFEWNHRPWEQYNLIKYYLCRFPEQDEESRYLKRWVEKFEEAADKQAREAELSREREQIFALSNKKKFKEAFAFGKQFLADHPDDIETMIAISWVGLEAELRGYHETRSEALTFAQRATREVEAQSNLRMFLLGPRNRTLCSLKYAIAVLSQDTTMSRVPGVARPGSECEELIDALKRLVKPAAAKPSVRKPVTTSPVSSGPDHAHSRSSCGQPECANH